ncbi:hypothetical protein [Vibrio vulnificus YJ016]|uniref:Uncharacterized protein n=1 Tax=Vibrio vulnificus (strain YJ016) TaxID=196600 RepID=Q7MG93_VIBVY|nr:hypothetical protein VVMO6_03054 [Vibrio vulnificus MO6-24/O]BAC96102.1 hypothetical protein [Vibrio vulnificus YJ016]
MSFEGIHILILPFYIGFFMAEKPDVASEQKLDKMLELLGMLR